MRGKSHICLGQYLIEHYMKHAGELRQKVFLFGCVQPDRNPFTYLKGSLRCRWLQGHNYGNAERFLGRIIRRLERRKFLRIRDYYTLGKLVHYTADAFTYAHNEGFPSGLSGHREYERALQECFLTYLRQADKPDAACTGSAMDIIKDLHESYTLQMGSMHTDCVFALQACCRILTALMPAQSVWPEYENSFREDMICSKN